MATDRRRTYALLWAVGAHISGYCVGRGWNDAHASAIILTFGFIGGVCIEAVVLSVSGTAQGEG